MKLTEVKQFRETTYRKKIKEAFPNASEQIINEAVSAAMNEIDFRKGLQTGLNTVKKLGGVAKQAVKTAAPVVRKAGQTAVKTGKNIAQKTTKVAKQGLDKTKKVVNQVGKDIGQGYKNIKQVGAKAVGAANQALDQAKADMGGDDQAQAKAQNQQLRKSTNRLKSMTGLKSPAIAAQALQRAAQGEVLKPNERKEVAPILQALATAMNSGTGTQRIISLIQQTKAK